MQLAPERDDFDGAALPTGFTWTPWASGGTAGVADGQLSADGAQVVSGTPVGPGHTLEFRAVLSDTPFENVGFADTFGDGPWATFSTGGGAPATGLYTRTASGAFATTVDAPILGLDVTRPHTYRIEWTAPEVRYHVDGTLVDTETGGPAGPLHTAISDFDADGSAVTVDWLKPGTFRASGTFVSRVLDAGDANAVWGALTVTGSTGVSLETRSGGAPAPGASWSDFAAVGADGRIASPAGRYLQYRATLTTSDPATTPSLDSVVAGYDVPPTTTIAGVAVTGTTASVRFSSPAVDLDHFQCKLDDRSFVPCSSPDALADLAPGAHTIAVRAVDRTGNVGAVAADSFSVRPAVQAQPTPAPAPKPGGGGPAPAVDRTAPTIRLTPSRVRASRSGNVRLTAHCPATERSCRVSVRIARGDRLLARGTITIAGGKSRRFTVRLSAAALRQLGRAGRLTAIAVLTGRDAGGNAKTRHVHLTLLAPGR